MQYIEIEQTGSPIRRRGALAAVVWLEGLARQVRGRNELHGELRRLAADWLGGRPLSARWRVRRAAKLLAGCAGRDDGQLPNWQELKDANRRMPHTYTRWHPSTST